MVHMSVGNFLDSNNMEISNDYKMANAGLGMDHTLGLVRSGT